ncbi:DEAD/DEAH box helicase [Bacillus cereus]
MELTLTQSDSEIQILFNKEENYFILDFIHEPQISYALNQIDGAVYGEIVEYKWVVPASQIKELNKLLHGKILWKSPEEMNEDKQQLEVTEETLEDVLSRIPSNIETPYMTINPYDFQKVAVAWAVTPKGKRAQIYGGLLADTMGLGKTIEALAISGYLKQMGKVKKCLVICPATLKMQWGQEIQKFTKEKAVIIEGTKKKRLKLYEKVKEEQPFYTVINYELLIQREKAQPSDDDATSKKTDKKKRQKTKQEKGDYIDLKYILENDYDMVVIDESHRMKNPDTLTSIAIRHIQPEYRLLMTGTPIEKDLQNIFQLMDYISPNIFSHESIDFETRRKLFEDRFLIISWNPFTKWNREKMVVGVKNIGILRQLVAPYMLRRTTDDVSDELPKMVGHASCTVLDWSPEQKALYNDLKKELLALEEQKKKIKTPEDAEKIDNKTNEILLYMLEVCDHPELLLMSKSPWAKQLAMKRLGNNKAFSTPPKLKWSLDKVEEIMRDTDQKIVIFSRFERMTQILRREITEISKKLAKEKNSQKPMDFGIMMYTGETPKGCKWKNAIEKAGEEAGKLDCINCPFLRECNSRTKSAWFFQNYDNARVIVMTDAGNYGVNLQSGKHLMNYTLPDSFSKYDQRNGRVQRLGSTHDQVFIYNPVVQGGLDEKKFRNILEQKELAGFIVEKNEDEKEAVIDVTFSMNKELIKQIKNEK